MILTRAPRVSVVIPVYNGERFVKRAIESTLNQVYQDREVIVVDDGSTDGTGRILEGFGDRVRILRQPNRGAYAARNLAIRHALGEFVAFLDADDEWLPERLALQVPKLDADQTVGLVFGDGEIVDETGIVQDRFFVQGAPARGRVFDELLERPFIPQSSVLVRRSCLDHVGPFTEVRMGADYQKWLQLSRLFAVDFVDAIVFRYTWRGDNTSADTTRRYQDLLTLFADLCETTAPSHRARVRRRLRELEYEFALLQLRDGASRLGQALWGARGLSVWERVACLMRVVWTVGARRASRRKGAP